MNIDYQKNRNRDKYTFANINLLGKCNVDCFFCLGKDIEKDLSCHNQLTTHYSSWKNFMYFLDKCRKEEVKKLYLTGQNTDPLMYKYLNELIVSLKDWGFSVGIRTNGYLAEANMPILQKLNDEIGYSIHSINPITTRMILGRSDIPNWDKILPNSIYRKFPEKGTVVDGSGRVRISIVINRCNKNEFYEILKYLMPYRTFINYIQVRRVSTDTRLDYLMPDIKAYEELYTEISKIFPMIRRFATDAEEYEIYGFPVCFWRTVKTSVNSLNYFTDGTVSDEYFIVEGYLKHKDQEEFLTKAKE